MATYYVRTDGSDTNAGTGPAINQAWQTVQKALGATGIGVGDTLYIAPGVYRESVTAAFTNPANEGQRVTISGDPTCSQFPGVTAGPVIITSYLNATSTTGSPSLIIAKSYVTLQNIHVTGYTPGNTGFYGNIFSITGTSIIVTSCGFYTPANNVDMNVGVSFNPIQSTTGFTVSKCIIFAPVRFGVSGTTSAWDTQSTFTDCIFQNPSAYTPTACFLLYSPSGAHIGGVTIQNCRFIGNTGVAPYPANNMSTTYPIVIRNCIFETSTGITSTTNNGQITQSYNIFNCGTNLTNVGSSGTSFSRAFISPDFNMSRITGWGNYPYWSNHSSSASQNAGTLTGAPATDMYGITWTTPSTPTMGSIEYADSALRYLPTERNASTITIAPGSTSQSIELYLGTTGLTVSTSGLSARYNRTRTASVSIPLVARTIAQAWTAGGFAEVDATNMPGVYRLDLPDAALAAGADDVTIVVRGASGTNGAVMTVKLSSGGLTEAQTAAAVWDAATASYVTASTMGARVLKTTVDNRPVMVGIYNHIHSNVHAIVDIEAAAVELLGSLQHDGTGYVDSDIVRISTSTAAADELEGALLHNGTDYISADLLTPVSAATSVHIGPYQLLADGLGADQPLDVNVGTATSIDVQVTDANGTGIDITGATVTVKIYNAGGTLVATYSGTATYADNGRLSFGLTTTVTNTSGTYTVTVTRTTGATDTQVFGPLKLYVRPV
jgi:hypothetical protein